MLFENGSSFLSMTKSVSLHWKTSLDDQPNHPEDSRRLDIVQNIVKADVNKTDAAAFEDERLKYHAKENVIKLDTAAVEDVVQKLSIL